MLRFLNVFILLARIVYCQALIFTSFPTNNGIAQQGAEFQISWTANGFKHDQTLELFLAIPGANDNRITSNIPALSGTYTWIPPMYGIRAGGDYMIRANLESQSFSSNTFIIVPPNTQLGILKANTEERSIVEYKFEVHPNMDFKANILFQSTEGVTIYARRDRPISFGVVDPTNFYDSKTSVLNHTIGMKNCDDSKITDPIILYITIRSNAPLINDIHFALQSEKTEYQCQIVPERAAEVVMMDMINELYSTKPALKTKSYDYYGSCVTFTKLKVFHNSSRNAYGELWVSELTETYILVYRGTLISSLLNVISDIQVDKTPCTLRDKPCGLLHLGFLEAYLTINDQIKKYMKSLNSSYTFYTGGHSLGAGFAVLSAYDFAGMDFKRMVSITFGGPSVGDIDFYNAFQDVMRSTGMEFNRYVSRQSTDSEIVLQQDVITTINNILNFVHMSTPSYLTYETYFTPIEFRSLHYSQRYLSKLVSLLHYKEDASNCPT